jgi:fermentation-respiration switch protein FrsA (DUF1100 family)
MSQPSTVVYDPTVPPPSPGVYDLGEVVRRDVRFDSDGFSVAGHLYLPPGRQSGSDRCSAVVLDGPGGSVKELTVPVYAIKLARAGHLVLTFDRRGFGESEGRLRQNIEPHEHIRDLRNATTYLLSRDEVDPERVAGVGVCMGGGFMLQNAAADRRLRVVAVVAGAYGNVRPMREMLGHDGWVAQAKASSAVLLEDLRAGRARMVQGMAPSTAPPGTAAVPIDEGYNFYLQRQEQVAPNWQNAVTVESQYNLLMYDAIPYAPLVTPTPLLVVHGTIDDYFPPRYAQEVHDTAGDPKKLVWIETTNHVQLYDIEPYVTDAAQAIASWLDDHMA